MSSVVGELYLEEEHREAKKLEEDPGWVGGQAGGLQDRGQQDEGHGAVHRPAVDEHLKQTEKHLCEYFTAFFFGKNK